MKISLKTFAIGLLLVASLALICTSGVYAGETGDSDQTGSQGVGQKTRKAIQDIKGYSVEQRDRAVKEAKQVMVDLDKRIEQTQSGIKKNWDRMDQATRNKMNDTLKTLKAQREELSEWYGDLKHSSASSWEHVKKGFVDGYESLAGAFDKVKKDFQSGGGGKN